MLRDVRYKNVYSSRKVDEENLLFYKSLLYLFCEIIVVAFTVCTMLLAISIMVYKLNCNLHQQNSKPKRRPWCSLENTATAANRHVGI